jgi:nitroreductase
MDFLDILHQRQCYRDFESTPIPAEDWTKIFAAAQRAPSSKNTQPWTAHLVQGKALEALRSDYVAAFEAGEKPRPDYTYTLDPLPDEWRQRARTVGFGLFAHKGIAKGEKEKMHAHYLANFAFFNAPHVVFLTLPKDALEGNFLDLGLYAQSLMLALTATGYGSCPMYSAVSFPDLLRKHIPGTDDTVFTMGLACGKPNDAHVNSYYTEREEPSAVVQIVE